MNLSEVLSELESLGTEQNRKVYRRHGVVGEQSGLSFSNLNNLAKRYKHADELARQLWESGNHDARMLAIKIANPAQLTADSIDAWVERKNRVRYAMNNALIAIGIRNYNLEQKALAAAEQVGEVHVDHNETNCQTPFAAEYIRKTWARRDKRAKVG